MISVNGLDINLVNSGSGLYRDETVSDRFVYKGNNPNNYILFNKELWRILSFEPEGIKIMKNGSIGDMVFDEKNYNDWNSSSLKKYLNSFYYNSMSSNYRKLITNLNVDLMSMNEYLSANSNNSLCGEIDLYFRNEKTCYQTNYINSMMTNSSNNCAWTVTRDEASDNSVLYAGNTYFPDNEARFNLCGVLPVVYLKKSIGLNGKGTKINPFKIER